MNLIFELKNRCVSVVKTDEYTQFHLSYTTFISSKYEFEFTNDDNILTVGQVFPIFFHTNGSNSFLLKRN